MFPTLRDIRKTLRRTESLELGGAVNSLYIYDLSSSLGRVEHAAKVRPSVYESPFKYIPDSFAERLHDRGITSFASQRLYNDWIAKPNTGILSATKTNFPRERSTTRCSTRRLIFSLSLGLPTTISPSPFPGRYSLIETFLDIVYLVSVRRVPYPISFFIFHTCIDSTNSNHFFSLAFASSSWIARKVFFVSFRVLLHRWKVFQGGFSWSRCAKNVQVELQGSLGMPAQTALPVWYGSVDDEIGSRCRAGLFIDPVAMPALRVHKTVTRHHYGSRCSARPCTYRCTPPPAFLVRRLRACIHEINRRRAYAARDLRIDPGRHTAMRHHRGHANLPWNGDAIFLFRFVSGWSAHGSKLSPRGRSVERTIVRVEYLRWIFYFEGTLDVYSSVVVTRWFRWVRRDLGVVSLWTNDFWFWTNCLGLIVGDVAKVGVDNSTVVELIWRG